MKTRSYEWIVMQAGDSYGKCMSPKKEGKLTSTFAAKACTPLAVAPARKRPAEVTTIE